MKEPEHSESEIKTETELMPVAFVGHGSPMNALELNDYTDAWERLGASIPAPRAILSISAHWFIGSTRLTSMAAPKTIHDFYGFPEELFQVQYGAPGEPQLAEEIAEMVKPDEATTDPTTWGLDHGTWSVLVHMFPEANVPVVQLSLNANEPPEYHFELGAKLAELRRSGVFVIASGNVVHNLRMLDWSLEGKGYGWAEAFGEETNELMTSNPQDAISLTGHKDFNLASPTPDHFLPLLYVAGMASQEGAKVELLTSGYEMGAISMAAFTIGARVGL